MKPEDPNGPFIPETPNLQNEEINSENSNGKDNNLAPTPKPVNIYLIILVIIGLCIIGIPIGFYLHRLYKEYKVRQNARYIPQPFVQNYEFRTTTMENGLETVYVKLNQNKRKFYVGELISAVSRCWERARPERCCWFYAPRRAYAVHWVEKLP